MSPTRLSISIALFGRLAQGVALLSALLSLAASIPQGPHLQPQFGQLPLLFEPMPGGDPHLASAYLCRGPGYALRVSSGAVDILLHPKAGSGPDRRRAVSMPQHAVAPSEPAPTPAWLRMRFLGANESAQAVSERMQHARVNELRGSDSTLWRKNVPTYAQVRYLAVYPGIDTVFYGNHRELEYDFVVAPHADPTQIRVQFEGADHIEVEENGDLVIHLADRQARLRRPFLYQDSPAGRRPVAGTYALEPGAGRVVRFEVDAYDLNRALVIDPVLVYSTYLGGLGYDQGNGVAVDDTGHAYVAGETASIDFPVANAFSPTNSGGFVGPSNPLGNEAFIAKFDPAGTNLIYATYLGGTGIDAAIGIAVDGAGHAYVTGLTASTNFPVTPDAFQTVLGGEPILGFHPYAAFGLKLSPGGDELLYSTYLGGTSDDLGLAIALDDSGAAYVTGTTASNDFPVHDETAAFGGDNDVFVAKLSPSGDTLLYSILLGGAGAELGQSIAVDPAGHAVVVGQTASVAFPVTNAVQTQFRGGNFDAFVSKLMPDGRSLVFSTYLGGSSWDEAYAVAMDATGNSYVTGYTSSGNFPLTNALFGVHASNRDAFLTKLSPSGDLLTSTFLGGNSHDEGWAVAVDAIGRATIAGTTQSVNFPITNALQAIPGGNRDLFITQFNPAADALEFSTYLGGRNHDEARGVALDRRGGIYVTGFTLSTDFPLGPSTNAFQPTFGGGTGDAFLLKIRHEPAALQIARAPTGVLSISWPASLEDFMLESRPLVTGTNGWVAVTNTPVFMEALQTVTLTNLADTLFFRLRRAN
jgi:hypothetical protein